MYHITFIFYLYESLNVCIIFIFIYTLLVSKVSYTKETFQDLSLPIPNRDHLHMIHATQGSHQKSGGACTDVYSHKGWFSTFLGWMIR